MIEYKKSKLYFRGNSTIRYTANMERIFFMVLGERIKRIRTFRGLTQRELGLKLGYEERSADVRVAQYESGYRVPKKDTLMEIAQVLNVNYINFITEAPGCAEDIMQTFFWLDEDDRNIPVKLMLLTINPSVIMTVMNGPLMLLLGCGSITVW